MKKLLSFLFVSMICGEALTQVPYLGKSPGDKKLYGYTSVKLRPGINNVAIILSSMVLLTMLLWVSISIQDLVVHIWVICLEQDIK